LLLGRLKASRVTKPRVMDRRWRPRSSASERSRMAT